MPSVIQKRFYNSVKVFWLDKELLATRIGEAVKSLTLRHPEVRRVVLFGSVADNRPTPASDIDILIIVDNCQERFLDRPLLFRRYFEGIGLGTDIFVYTNNEVVQGMAFVNTALKKGKVLFNKEA